jgi:NADPH-dependent ferric siderophore reductase
MSFGRGEGGGEGRGGRGAGGRGEGGRGGRGGGEGRGGRGGGGGGRQRLPRKQVEVSAVSKPTPKVVRVTVKGELSDWQVAGPGAYMKIFLPVGPDGSNVMRTYTVREFDKANNEATIDFALHEHGPASDWARVAKPGDKLEMAGSARSTFEPASGKYVFGGDEASLPAIASCLASLPADAEATVIVEVDDPQEEQDLTSPAKIDVRWLHRDNGSEPFIDTVTKAVDGDKPTEIWVACEADVMRSVRRKLIDSGYPVSILKTRGYWRRGEVDHSDHDTGDDVQ